MDLELKNKILYYGRHRYYQTMQNYALEGIKKFPTDVSFRLFSGYSLVLSNRHQEAIRELDNLHTMRDVNLGAIIALIIAHRACTTVDKEALTMLEEKLRTERKASNGYGLYYAAVFWYLYQKIDKARDYLERFLKNNNDSIEGLSFKGWIELSSDKTAKLKNASTAFKLALEKDKKFMEALLGLVKIKEIEGNFTEAVALVNQIVVKNSGSLIALIEKMKLQLSSKDWEQALETANRILTMDNTAIDAHKMKTLIILCKSGNFNEAAISLRKLLNEIDKSESKNAALFIEIASLFASVCCRNELILQETFQFAERAAQLEPGNPAFMAELGYQNLKLGKVKEANRCFKNTTKLDDSSVIGLTGMTFCQILSGGFNEQVKQQVDFLREVQNDDPSAELFLMVAKLSVSPVDALDALKQATHISLDKLKGEPYGFEYIKKMNVDFLMLVVRECMTWAGKSSVRSESLALYKNCLGVLEAIRVACPGLIQPQFELARVFFLMGDLMEAKKVLNHVLDELDAGLSDAHILMAQIYLQLKNYALAARSLENALSYNFQIREHPLYHLVSAMVHKQNNKAADCVKSLKSAMTAPGFATEPKDELFSLSLTDKATICLELVKGYLVLHQQNDAEELMKTTLAEFKGSAEEGRVYVANAELMIEKGSVKAAIDALQRIQPGESYYILARRALAEVYLNNLRNRDMYVQCYQDLVKIAPSKESFEMLGDACTFIQVINRIMSPKVIQAEQDPDGAISAYEEALNLDKNNWNLICKMGKSLVKTHHYTKAINYYKEAVKSNDNPQLLYDMADLYFKLGQLDNAERILTKHVNDMKIEYADLAQITAKTKLLQLLAKVRDKSGSLTDSLSALKEAKENHLKIEKRTLSQSDVHKAIVVEICNDTALLMTRLRDFNGAIKAFKEALTFRPNDPRILAGLARLYMQTNNIEECQAACQHLLATDPDSESAAIMLADIAFRKVDLETSGHHFRMLLQKRPDYWTALARLIEVLRRLGKLEEVKPFLDRAETQCMRANSEAGLFFCKALYDTYNGDPQKALVHFNRARGDLEWGQKATYYMIEICLNPDQETLGGDEIYYDMVETEIPDARENALRTAQRLLMEVKPRKGSDDEITHRLLENFWLLATRQKSNVEKALQDLVQIASDDYYKEHIGVGLAIATAFMLQKQTQKARTYLKRMVKTQWRFEDAEYLERSWLLLTDIHIQSGKTDLAADLIQRVLEHNKSCYKAYEYAGYIAEKEQLYKEASFQYENAWRYSGQCNTAVGYKLAFNHMKGKSYADAIDICHEVLKLNPNYPRIRKDILDKSRNHLRT